MRAAGSKIVLVGISLLFLGCQSKLLRNWSEELWPKEANDGLSAEATPTDPFYTSRVQTVLNRRCVACHACYAAPCQLQLGSYEGLSRGAQKNNVYDFELHDRAPTRLGIDAHSKKDWQKDYDFFSVLNEGTPAKTKKSIFWKMIQMGRAESGQWNEKGNGFEVSNSRTCPRESEWENYQESSGKGMPFGFPALNEVEFSVLAKWIQKGAPGPTEDELAKERTPSVPALTTELANIEEFLNQTDIPHQLVARYIFEHLFLAHIYFDDAYGLKGQKPDELPAREFFRLVRTTQENSLPGTEIPEIATRRPTDGPPKGQKIYYRFKKVTGAIVEKNHIVYLLNLTKLAQWQSMFFHELPWPKIPTTMPSYEMEQALNPYLTYAAIPAEARYRFLLNDNLYHIKTFINGPVCRGQVAVSSIEDHFWAYFIDPKLDPLIHLEPDFLEKNGAYLATAGTEGNKVPIRIGESISRFRQKRAELYQKHNFQFSNDLIWAQKNQSQSPYLALHDPTMAISSFPVLTILRHYDNASVQLGALGGMPRTVWVLDYHLFEELYYNLVAGYDVYGGDFHQIRSRVHMDGSRVNAQDLFLAFLPRPQREEMRKSWHQSAPQQLWQDLFAWVAKDFKLLEYPWHNVETHAFEPKELFTNTGEIKSPTELYHMLLTKWNTEIYSQKAAEAIQVKDCCNEVGVKNQNLSSQNLTESTFHGLALKNSPWVQMLPDLTYIRILDPDPEEPEVYSMVVNKSFLNLDYIFDEKHRRDSSHDYLNFFSGFAGSFPNLFIELRKKDLPAFKNLLESFLVSTENGPRTEPSTKDFLDEQKNPWFISRYQPDFWRHYDFFNKYYYYTRPIQFGIISLSHYTSQLKPPVYP